jgi:P22_AR N-terminal domain
MNASVSLSIVSVPFHGDSLDAVQTDDGKILVSIRRICDSLGIATQRQLEKLKRSRWACVTIMVTHDETGRRQELTMIDHESLPMWLATISPLNV